MKLIQVKIRRDEHESSNDQTKNCGHNARDSVVEQPSPCTDHNQSRKEEKKTQQLKITMETQFEQRIQ